MANMVGGFTETMDATEETQKFCDQVKCQVEEKTNEKYETFLAVKYRSQVVAGQIFLIKVHAGGYLLLKVLKKLSCNGGDIVLLDLQEDHGKDDPIVPF
ncbi:cystatin-B-like [Sebastes umbrosus]|uniref:cystatin-B-like n=1 Tax=Sebastes umbrosus TaxID=72105 RepID=UPI00189CCC83|nr:cystatin-B-like [Sebastes umbrosus]